MSFRRRSYPEVLNNVLAGILGGVTAEEHPFPPPETEAPPYAHALKKTPVAKVVTVYGMRNGQSHEFARQTDYALNADGLTLDWLEGAQLPDEGSIIHVSYIPAEARAAVTDLQVGSVVRTLAESVALEVSRIYAQLEGVYKSAFIGTAAGTALDNVVALLGMARIKAGRCTVELEFTRTPGRSGSIHIPAGTRIMTEDGSLEYETITTITMADGQNTAKITARDLEDNTQGAEAGSLTVMAKPISGIAGVTNHVAAGMGNADESDEALRTRAKNFLHGSERATVGAIKEAVTRQGIKAEVVEVTDANGNTGLVNVIPHTENVLEGDLFNRVNTAIQEARPAGVEVKIEGHEPPTPIDLVIRLTTSPDLLEADLRAAQELARQKISDYFAELPASENGSVNRIIGLVLGIAEIQDMEIIDSSPVISNGQFQVANQTTVLGNLEIIDPNLPTRLEVVITYPDTHDIPEQTGITDAMQVAVDQVNSMNASDSPDDDPLRELSFARLLYVLPLPPETLAHGVFDEIVEGTAVLPAESDADPYIAQFVLTRQSSVSRIVEAGSEGYTLTPFERLTFAGVQIETLS
jgi:hypothetical protein